MNNKIKTTYDICKLCLYSEVDKDCEWHCSKHRKELTELWGKNFECEIRKPL